MCFYSKEMKRFVFIAAFVGLLLQLCSCSNSNQFDFSKLSDEDMQKLFHPAYEWDDEALVLDLSAYPQDTLRLLELVNSVIPVMDAEVRPELDVKNMIKLNEPPYVGECYIADYTRQGKIGELVYFCNDEGSSYGMTLNKSSLEESIESEALKNKLGEKYDLYSVEAKKVAAILLFYEQGCPNVARGETVTVDGRPTRIIGACYAKNSKE